MADHDDGEVWRGRADELADWAWARLVNRTDIWGGYSSSDGKGRVRPAKARRGQEVLAINILRQHFRAGDRRDIIGLHTTSSDNTSRWGAVDIDRHGELPPPEVTQAAALAWYEDLRGLGFAPLLTGSNGAGGYHLRVLFERPAPTALVYDLLQWLTRDFEAWGLATRPEVFPKQRGLSDHVRCGSWLRLPGRHHTRAYYAEVWDGAAWRSGLDAVTLILAARGDDPALLQRHLEGRITAYLASVPNCGEGGRNNAAFSIACWLVRDLALDDDAALDWLGQWNAGNQPPLGAQELRDIVTNARSYGQNRSGSGLGGRRRTRGPAACPLDALALTDLGNAKYFADAAGDRLRWCEPWGRWLCWDGTCWRPDEERMVERVAREALERLFLQASRAVEPVARQLTEGVSDGGDEPEPR